MVDAVAQPANGKRHRGTATGRRTPTNQSPLNPRFRRLWATFAVSSFGDGFIYGAVPLLAIVVDPRPLAVSAVVAANSLPWLLLALHAGALSDRFERGRVMAVANVARGFVLSLMALLVGLHEMDLLTLLVFVLANGSLRAIYYSASQAAVPELIAASDFNRANGVLFGTEAATENMAGPVFGSIVFSVARAVPFLADAVAMVTSGFSLFGLRTNRPKPETDRGKLSDGLRQLFHDRNLRILVSLIAILAGLQGLVSGVLVLVATRDWGVHASAYGAFLATQGAGNVLGGLLANRVAKRLGTVWTLLGSAMVSGVGYLVMAASHSWAIAGGAFAVVGFAVGCGGVVAISLRQRLTPDRLMGRVGSAWRGIVWGAAPCGALAAGGLAILGGLRLPLLLAGVAQCVVAILLTRPVTRRLGAVDSRPKHPALDDGSGAV